MACVCEEIRLGFVGMLCLFESHILPDPCLDYLILCDGAHDHIGKEHHRKPLIIYLRELIPHLPEGRCDIYDHDQKENQVEIQSVKQIEEKENYRNADKEKKDTGAFRSAGIKEERKGYPIHDALDVDRKMHEPGAFLFAEFADAEINDGYRCHDRTEKSIFCDKIISAEEIIETEIYTEENEHRQNDDAKGKVYRDIENLFFFSI